MNNSEHKKTMGYFIKRSDILNAPVENLLKELQLHIFEINILITTIQYIQEQKFSYSDCSVGDWKCQTRTAMILDYIKDANFTNQELSQESLILKNLLIQITNIFQKINTYSHEQRQTLRHELRKISLKDYFQEHSLNYKPSDKLKFLSLCFLTTLKNSNLPVFTNTPINMGKIKDLIKQAKIELCYLSIQYEQTVAKNYGTCEEQTILQQIESKGIQHMTSFFPSFLAIWKKMKQNQESFIQRIIHFCSCGGTLSIVNNAFSLNQNGIITKKISSQNESFTIIEGYQFPGTFNQLKKILNLAPETILISKDSYKPCTCKNATAFLSINNVEDVILANFAQHPQFTNDAQINFEGLGLEKSNLKKEYDYLQNILGCNNNDMSIFSIKHMYPSTIAELLEQENPTNQSPLEKIKTTVRKIPIGTIKGIFKKPCKA